MNDTDDLLHLLTDLLQTIKDGEEGFETAAQDVDSKNLRDLFTRLSLERAAFRRELQKLAQELQGYQPDVGGSLVGAAHRGWIELRAVVATQNEAAILDECERGEDSAVAAFKKALSEELPEHVRVVIAEESKKIGASHDLVRDLRDKTKRSGD